MGKESATATDDVLKIRVVTDVRQGVPRNRLAFTFKTLVFDTDGKYVEAVDEKSETFTIAAVAG